MSTRTHEAVQHKHTLIKAHHLPTIDGGWFANMLSFRYEAYSTLVKKITVLLLRSRPIIKR
jgi:hypothetical protein